MKRYMHIAVLTALILCTFAGCRSGSTNNTTGTTPVTTQATTAPTTKPNMDDMLPGPEDTIDPSSGANQHESTEDTVPSEVPSRIRPRPRYIP